MSKNLYTIRLLLDAQGSGRCTKRDRGAASDLNGFAGLGVAPSARSGLLLPKSAKVPQSQLVSLGQHILFDDLDESIDNYLEVLLLVASTLLQLGEQIHLSKHLNKRKKLGKYNFKKILLRFCLTFESFFALAAPSVAINLGEIARKFLMGFM